MAKKYNNSSEIENKTKTKVSHAASSTAVLGSESQPIWLVILAGILFLFLLTLAGSMDNVLEKWIGLASSIIIALSVVGTKRKRFLKAYTSPLFFAVTAYVILGGISTFYAASGKFAIFEFSKLLFGFCIFLTVLLLSGDKESGFRSVSYTLSCIGTVYGLISIDAASSGIISSLFKAFLGLFTTVYEDRGVFEEGIRITGIFGNPNIYAGFMALSVLLSLYLVLSASSKRASRFATALLAINSLAYLLAFSLGSLFMFLISCFVMVGISEKGQRSKLLILMIETAVLAFIFVFVSMVGLGKSGALSYIPLIAVVLNIVTLYGLDIVLRPALGKVLNSNKKIAIRITLSLILLLVTYAFAAFTISGDLNLSSNETIMRAIYVKAGEYTLSTDGIGTSTIVIESQNEEDLIKHTTNKLATGLAQKEISFTVPEGSRIVLIRFIAGDEGATLYSAKYIGTERGDVHLNYPLLPTIIANRLQNIFANENMIQRGIYFEDGVKLYSKSPLIGRGLGGFENGIYGVQDFYYETKYAHNHYIQVLSDLGIVGFVLFLSILSFSITSIVSSKRQSRSLFAVPVLAACVFQSFGQALSDATWSSGVFLGFVFPILALLINYCSAPVLQLSFIKEKPFQLATKSILTLFAAVFILLLSGNLYAQSHAKSGVNSFRDIEKLISWDRFEYNDYKVSYLINAPKSTDNEVLATADIYAQELTKVESNSIGPYVMTYNFVTYKDVDAFDAAQVAIQNAKSSPNMWWRIFSICEDYIDPVGPNSSDAIDRIRSSQYYVDSVLDLYNSLLERNKNSLDKITLTPYNNAFVGKLLEIRDTHSYDTSTAMYILMAHAFDSNYAVDANQDGIPDSISILSGSMKRNDRGIFETSADTVLELNLYQKLNGSYTFSVRTETPDVIKISMEGTELQTAYDASSAYITADLPDNTEMKLHKFKVTIPTATIIENIEFIAELE